MLYCQRSTSSKIKVAVKWVKKLSLLRIKYHQKKGSYKNKIRYRCIACGRQFQHHSKKKKIEGNIWNKYVYQRQTIHILFKKYKRSKDLIRERIDNAPAKKYYYCPKPVVVIADVTFFRRNSAICVIRAPHLKKNFYVREVQTKSIDVYRQGRLELERQGYTIRTIVLDSKPGVRQIFQDMPVQTCHFHQKQTITRYLTNNLQASIEPKRITTTLYETNEIAFTSALDT